MFELMVTLGFSAGHRLRQYQGDCQEIHGHNWKVDFYVTGDKLDAIGMVVDFKDIKKIARDILSVLDHKYLNDIPYFKDINPTAEHLAKYIFDHAKARLVEKGACLSKIRLWETEKYCLTYYDFVSTKS